MSVLFICSEAIGCVKKRLFLSIIFIAMFIIGIILGVAIKKPEAIEIYYAENCEIYVNRVFSQSLFKIMRDRIFTFSLYIIFTIPLIFTVFYLPVQGILVLGRGFIIGTVTINLCSAFGFGGFFVWLVAFLPQAVVMSCVFIIFSVVAYDTAKSGTCRRRGGAIKSFLPYMLLALGGALLLAIIELLVILLIFRTLANIF